MYPASSPAPGPGGPPQPGRFTQPKRSAQKPPARGASRKGFWITIAVVLCAAAAAAAVLFWWMPSREGGTTATSTAQTLSDPDGAAQNLVRNAMTAMEYAYVELRDFNPATMTPEALTAVEPSITFLPGTGDTVATAPTAAAGDSAVNYFGTGTTYAVGTISESGASFGAVVEKGAGGRVTYYINGSPQDWETWSSSTVTTNPSEGPAASAAADAAAQSLLNNAMTAMEAAFVDVMTFDSATMTPAVLAGIEPSITFVAAPDTVAATAPTALAADSTVNYFGTVATWAVGTVSESGTTFGAVMDHATGVGLSYYADGELREWDAASGSTTTSTPTALATPAIMGLYEDAALGASFEYPASWIEYIPEQLGVQSLEYVSVYAVADPLGGTVASVPQDYMVYGSQSASTLTDASARTDFEQYLAAREQEFLQAPSVIEPLTEFEVNGLPGFAKSYRIESQAGALIYRIVFLHSGERAFFFMFWSEEANWDTNRPIFDATLDSFQATAKA